MLKDMVVYLNGGSGDAARLAQAEALGAQHDAHITGVFCNEMPEMLVSSPMGIGNPEIVLDLQREAEKKGDEIEQALKAKISALSGSTDLRRLDVTRDITARLVAAEARRADLFIGSRPSNDPQRAGAVFESVLFLSGGACLSVPEDGTPSAFKKVLIGWSDTREAALAVALGLPVFGKADQVVLCMVTDDDAPEAHGEMPGADMARHLNRHGVDIELTHVTGWHDAGAALLNEASQMGADLIVMGGYGHSRLREWVLGGVTGEIFQNANIPVLMAH